MTAIDIDGFTKHYGDVVAVNEFNLAVEEG